MIFFSFFANCEPSVLSFQVNIIKQSKLYFVEIAIKIGLVVVKI